MSEHSITVRVDDRVRLMAALLAMTDWPEREQQTQPHGVHAHARATQKHLAGMAEDAAVTIGQELLEEGHTPADFFAFSQELSWPGLRARGDVPEWVPDNWTPAIRNFHIAGKLAALWKEEAGAWDRAAAECEAIFLQGDVIALLTPYLGAIERKLIFMPNLGYPTLGPLAFASGEEVVCVCPPQLATGTNPPWPYKDDPAWVYRAAFEAFGGVLVRDYLDSHPEATENLQEGELPLPDGFRAANPDWRDQFVKIFVGAATAIFLEETAGKAEAEAYIVMEHKSQGFDILPSAVSVLGRYLAEREQGRYDELADYLPVFRNNLRVASRLLG